MITHATLATPLLRWHVLCAMRSNHPFHVQAPRGTQREVLPRYETAGRGVTYSVQGRRNSLPRVWMRSAAAPRGFLSRLAECDRCERAFDKTIVETLKQIVTLPEALGKPLSAVPPQMRRLPDGVFHCPVAALRCCPFPSPKPDRVRARRSLASSRDRLSSGDQRRKGIWGWGSGGGDGR